MSRMGINYQAVEGAALQLQGSGKNPTVDRIREILGTGSKSTIARHLKAWHQQSTQSIPKNLPQELMSMVSTIWTQLQEKSSEQMIELTLEHEEKIKKHLLEMTSHEEEFKALQIKATQLEKNLSEQTHLTQKTHQALTLEQEEKTRISHHANMLDQAIADQKSENAKLYQLFNNVQKNLEHYQLAMQRLQQEQLLAMDNQKGQYERKLSDLREQISFECTEKTKLIVQLEQISMQSLNDEKRISDIEAALTEKSISEALFKDRCENLAKLYDKNLQKLDETMQSLLHAQEKSTMDTSRIAFLTQNVEDAQEKIQLLQAQCSLFVQEKANLEARLELMSIPHV